MRLDTLATLGTVAFVFLFLLAIGGVAFLFISSARKAAGQPRWADRYRLRDPLPPGMVQDHRAASSNRNFADSFRTAKDKVLSYVFGTSTVVHVGPSSACEMFSEGDDGRVRLELSRGSAYVQHGDVAVRVKLSVFLATPHLSRFMVVVDGKDLVVHCFQGETVVGLDLLDNPWSCTLKEGRSYRFPERSWRTPVEDDIPTEASALDAALQLRPTPEAPAE